MSMVARNFTPIKGLGLISLIFDLKLLNLTDSFALMVISLIMAISSFLMTLGLNETIKV